MNRDCERCNGGGKTTPDHPNDPFAREFDCDDCGGEGQIEVAPRDLDGEYARYVFLTGYLTWQRRNNSLTIENEYGVQAVNLQPDDVQLLAA